MPEINSIYTHLLSPSYKQDIRNWLKEDVPSFDYGGFVVGETREVAILYGKSAVIFYKTFFLKSFLFIVVAYLANIIGSCGWYTIL
jgi:hypothetical protein